MKSLVRGKRATPRLAVVNKIAGRMTLTSSRSTVKRFPADPETSHATPGC